MSCPCPAQGWRRHHWNFHVPWRCGSRQGVWGAPEQPVRPVSHDAHPGRVSGQAGAEWWYGSAISHDDLPHHLAAGMEKMALGEQHAKCQHPAMEPGNGVGPSTTSHHPRTSTPLQHPAGHGAPWALPRLTVETPRAGPKPNQGLPCSSPSPVPWSQRGSRGISAPGLDFWAAVYSMAVHPLPRARREERLGQGDIHPAH